MNVLLELFFTFAYLGLISFGGSITVTSEMERQVVAHGWMTHQAFVEAFALGLLAPGPNLLHIFLIGYKVAGVPGAIATGVGMIGPAAFLLVSIAWLARGVRHQAWIKRFHAALGPVTLGLFASTAWTLGQGMAKDVFWLAVCGVTALLSARRLLDPAWVVLLAASAGAAKVFFLS